MSWPPLLAELKLDAGISDTRDDDKLAVVLAASVAFVERVRGTSFNFDGDLGSALPAPTDDLVLGTLRLAIRWHNRRRSPDALVDMAELGAARVPSFDTDIDRLLGIGRFRGPVFA